MYQVSVEQHFDAAHYLREYGGKCENMHGHRFKVVATVGAEKLDDTGLAYDFAELKKHLTEIISQYDHTCINEIAPFDKINTSSENIARTICEQLTQKLPGGIELLNIQVWESPQSCVTYTP